MDSYYPDPIDVGLDIVHRDGRYAWGVALPAGEHRKGALPAEATLADARLAAVTALVTDPALAGMPVNLTCGDEGLAAAVSQLRRHFPNIEVRPFTPHVRIHQLARTARAYAHQALPQSAPAPDPEPVIAATDGSLRRGTSLGGWGWVTSTGQYGFGQVPASAPLVAELAAVRNLLAGTSRKAPLRVMCDSRAALALLRDLRASDGTGEQVGYGQVVRHLEAIRGLLAGRDVTFEWVRGHAGNPLNEGADRLAVHARRSVDADPAVRRGIAARIAAETHSVLEAAVPAA